MKQAWLIVTGDFTRGGGQDRANYELARYLVAIGRRVHLVAHRVAEDLRGQAEVHLVRRPAGSHFIGGYSLRRNAAAWCRVLTERESVVHVLANGGNFSPSRATWVHAVHGEWSVQDKGIPLHQRLKLRVAKTIARSQEREALHKTELIIVNSQVTRAAVLGRFNLREQQVRVVYLGTGPEFKPFTNERRLAARRSFGIPVDGYVAAFVGSLGYDRNKGFETAVRVCAAVGARLGARIHLLAAGGGKLEFWTKEVERIGLATPVQFLGHLESITDVLAAADLMLAPSSYEAYGLAAAEGLACALPTFVARNSGIAERLPRNLSWLLLPSVADAQACAEHVGNHFPVGRQQKGALLEFSEFLRSHTWAQMAEEIRQLVEDDG